MSHGGQETQGTGLRDVFDILVKAPQERLLSLTFQLGESPEDNIIHALCLIVLQKEAQALNKLQSLRDNYLAKHLAEKCQMSGGKLEDFAVHCSNFQEFTGESLVTLARIFKVLSEQRLCDPLLRNLAYKRALSSDDQKASNCEDLEYDRLGEEAKVVCGPQFVEWMCSPTDLKSESYRDHYSSLSEENTTLKVTQDQSDRAHSLPSPLQATSLMPSYPTHLEISIPPTALFRDVKRTPEKSNIHASGEKNAPGQSQKSEEPQLKSNEPLMFGAKKHARMDETSATDTSKLDSHITLNETPIRTTKPTTEPNFALPTATNIILPKMPVSNGAEEDEEEATFYPFVILHAPEDAEMAETIREKLSKVIGDEGATFSEEFATAGKCSLRCVEDAINNTAFTILLLTHNFNNHMQEIETNSALINSVNKKHKHNTVIPLLPQENCMPRQSIPLVLQGIVPLVESKSFERKIQKSLTPARIKKMKKHWLEEQEVKRQKEKQERLKHLNQHQRQMLKECKAVESLETENLGLLVAQKLLLRPNVPPELDGADGRAWWQQQQPNIHIEHAKYIMIGNDSQMTVDLSGGAHSDDDEP
ncbi:TIR domain-containing adapter molecule 1 [Morone saxatilis]|uniref:TIR domain-containing adapter molecule 1 n=1 Tax=Morone saxatilis TaxID=34816 RepID=UPI0015E1FF8E|nr:TIR domain-containing adapter molecule 1 [Morone saxatilis]XP_035526088.1 TIR domain-containing adapter molecule 1 [Morone saxatilis]